MAIPSRALRPANRASSTRCRLGPIVARVALTIGATAVGLLLAEGILRLVAPQPPSWLDVYQRHPSLPTFSLQPNIARLIDTGETRWECITDAQGFRVSQHPSTKDARGQVLCLGDSFTFAHGVDHEQSFVGLLDADDAMPLRFLNAGVSGYGPVQYLQVLDFQFKKGLSPTAVVVTVFLGNDFYDCIWNKDQQVVDGVCGGREHSLKAFLKLNSHLYRVFSKVYHMTVGGESYTSDVERRMFEQHQWSDGDLARARARFEESFSAIADLCEEHATSLYVVLLPARLTVLETNQSVGEVVDSDQWIPNVKAMEVFRGLGINALDLSPDFAGAAYRQNFFKYDGHSTPEGHRLVASKIRGLLEPEVHRVSR